MARIVVIGATGHIGTYLVPRLVRAGHDVVAVTRGSSKPYLADPAWSQVQTARLDRDILEASGDFGRAIAELGGDVVIDNICFTLDSARQLAEALIGNVQHFIHIGTIWTHGHSEVVPTPEDVTKRPFGEYGMQKAAIEAYLLGLARRQGFPATIIHPGHIVGQGWSPLNPAGHFDDAVFATLARGEQLALPNFGMETVHHIHADDIACLIINALTNWQAAAGEAFHAVSSGAVTLRHYAGAMSRWFGHEPDLVFLPWEDWKAMQTPKNASATWEHIIRSPNCSIEKGRRLLGYAPRYSSLEAVQQSVSWLLANGKLGGVTGPGQPPMPDFSVCPLFTVTRPV